MTANFIVDEVNFIVDEVNCLSYQLVILLSTIHMFIQNTLEH